MTAATEAGECWWVADPHFCYVVGVGFLGCHLVTVHHLLLPYCLDITVKIVPNRVALN